MLVERVEELAPAPAWQRAYREIREFERWLVDDGIRLVKVFLSIDQKEQDRRFIERLSNPRKYWKLTQEDIRNRLRWADYQQAVDDMFAQTHKKRAPWLLVDGRHKWRARIHVLEYLCDQLSRHLEVEPPTMDPAILNAARHTLGLEIPEDV